MLPDERECKHVLSLDCTITCFQYIDINNIILYICTVLRTCTHCNTLLYYILTSTIHTHTQHTHNTHTHTHNYYKNNSLQNIQN